MRLSIVIPTFNDKCFALVADLQQQAEHDWNDYEIIVADDGSTDNDVVEANKRINTLPHSRYIINKHNVGRAGIRNFLADQATGEWLLFIDSDLHVLRTDFLLRYKLFAETHSNELCSVYGGYDIPSDNQATKGNLRYKYEKSRRALLDIKHRQANADKDFKTSNVMISRAVFERVRFDEAIRSYGYEDTLFGEHLKRIGIPVHQIDNPVLFSDFEDNESFLLKSMEAIDNVLRLEHQLANRSRLLQQVNRLQRWHLRKPLMLLWQMLRRPLSKNLTGNTPSVLLFNVYKILYANSISKQKQTLT